MTASRFANPILAGALSIVAAVGLLALAVSREMPVGALKGTIVAQESGAKLDVDVSLRPAGTEEWGPQVARTEAIDGKFSFQRVPVGEFVLQVNSRWRNSPPIKVTIQEGKTETLNIELPPGEPKLELYVHQHIFTPDERAQVTCMGYMRANALDVRVYKVDVNALITGYGADLERLVGSGSGYREWERRFDNLDLASKPGLKLAESLSSPIAQRESEGNFTKRIDLPKLEPGMYVFALRADNIQRVGWIAVTDLGLVTKTAGRDALAFVVDLKTGAPIEGADVAVYDGSDRLASGRTNGDGLAPLRAPAGQRGETTILARKGQSFAFVSTHLSTGARSREMVYAYTDRPVYRPGQRVFFRGTVRDSNGESYSVPAGKQVTVEVRDPNDTLIHRAVKTTDRFGCYHGQLPLNPETATGTYSLVTTTGAPRDEGEDEEDDYHDRGERAANFEVAAYSKPEFTAKVTFARKRYIRGDQIVARVKAEYYFGAPVANAEVQYNLHRSDYWLYEPDEDESEGDEYEGYSDYGGYGEWVDDGTVKTDENGEAEIVFPADWPEPKGNYGWDSDQEFTVEATVTDKSRRETTGSGSVVATRGEFAIDATPDRYVVAPGTRVNVEIEAKDYDRRPVANQELTVLIGREFWTGNESVFRKSEEREVKTDKAGRASIQFTPKRTGSAEVVVSSRDSRGNRICSTTYVYVTSDTSEEVEGERYPDLRIVTDKRTYAPGETATVLVTAKRPGAAALVTVEGDRLYDHRVVRLKGNSTSFTIPVKANYKPNFYIGVCFVRGKYLAQQEKRVKVSLRPQTVNVRIEPNKKRYLPGENATYKLKATDDKGRPMRAEVSLGIVDEAIYAIAKDTTTPILDYFYSRKPNRVSTGFSFPEIYLSDPDKAGMSAKMPRQQGVRLRKRFEDTAFWQPDVVTGTNGEATVSFQMPDNLTTWRATARAITLDTRCGQSTNAVLAQQDMLVRLQTPRFLVQGDETTMSAIVHNYTGSRDRVDVRFSAPGLNVRGSRRRTVTVANGGSERIDWTVRAPKPGSFTLTVRAKGSQAGDAMQLTLPVYPHGEERQTTTAGSLGTQASADIDMPVRNDSIPEATKLTLRLAPSLASAMLGSLEYLAQYPYGCTEQTTSSFLPDVILSRSLKDLGVRDLGLEKILPDMVQTGLLRLYRFQLEDGGWSWCEYGKADPWMTAYVCYGLIQAQRAGFAVNRDALGRGIERLQASVGKREVNSETKAFGYYVLALAGIDVGDDMARLAQVRVLPARTLAILTLGFSEAGQRDYAKVTLDRLFQQAIVEPGMIHWTGDSDYDGGNVETTALALRALLKVNRADPRALRIVAWLMHERKGDNWYSTRDTAMTLYAMADFLKGSRELTPDYVAEIRVNGKPAGRFRFTSASVFEPDRIVTITSSDLHKGPNRIEITKAGVGNLYYTAKLTQYLAAKGDIPATVTGAGITISRAYYRPGARFYEYDSRSALGSPITSCSSGDVVMVRLTVQATKHLDHLLLEDYIPAGCEIIDKGHVDYWDWYYWYVGRDIRDEKISFYLDSLKPGKYVADYQMRAGIPGTYHAMPAQVFGMYDPSMRAATAEAGFEVR